MINRHASCDSLGVCQSRTPRCQGCDADQAGVSLDDSPWDWIERTALIVGAVISLAVVAAALFAAYVFA